MPLPESGQAAYPSFEAYRADRKSGRCWEPRKPTVPPSCGCRKYRGGRPKMPFLADDLFINYDDDRSRAGFEGLGELAWHTQVIFFTHHEHLMDFA